MVQHCCTWLHVTLHMLLWVYMDLLDFTPLYLGSTWFYLTYLNSAIVPLKFKTIKFNFGRFIKLFTKIFSNKIYCYTVLCPLYLGSICAILTHSCLVGLRISTAERSTPRRVTGKAGNGKRDGSGKCMGMGICTKRDDRSKIFIH